jgi:hypothetical protein
MSIATGNVSHVDDLHDDEINAATSIFIKPRYDVQNWKSALKENNAIKNKKQPT